MHRPFSPSIDWERTGVFSPRKEGMGMKMVVVNAPKALAGLLKKLFRI